jgi:hypothetical protein
MAFYNCYCFSSKAKQMLDQRAVEQKTVEQKAVEQKVVEQKAVEQKALEQKGDRTKSEVPLPSKSRTVSFIDWH